MDIGLKVEPLDYHYIYLWLLFFLEKQYIWALLECHGNSISLCVRAWLCIKVTIPREIFVYADELLFLAGGSRCNCFNSAAGGHEKATQWRRKLFWGRAWWIPTVTQKSDDWFPVEAECSWYWGHSFPCLSDGCFSILVIFGSWLTLRCWVEVCFV